MAEQSRKIVVVGGVAAGMKVASRLRRLDPQARITVLERGPHLSYGACALPYYLEGLFDDLSDVMRTPTGVLRDRAFFERVKGVEVRSGTEVLAVDRGARVARGKDLASGALLEIPYDRLVLATGSRPVLPPVEGIGLDGVHPLKSVADAERLQSGLATAEKAVIVGGGLIGLEMAEALAKRGVAVTLLEMQDQVLGGVLDGGLAGLVHRELKMNGVALRLGEPLLRLEGEGGRVSRVVTGRGSYPADLVVMAIGVRPEVALAAEAGLELGPTGAIAVDSRMQTSDPAIYAAGDCAEVHSLLDGKKRYLPLGSTANKQARVAANALGGVEDAFPGVLGSLIVKVFNLNAARTGLGDAEARAAGFDPVSLVASGPDRVHHYPGMKPVVIKLTADRSSRRLLGAQVVGPGAVDKRIDTLVASITLGATVDQVAQLDLCYAPPFATAMDPLLQTANALRNKLDGRGKSFDPTEVEAMRQAGRDILLLDVRSPEEYAEVRIPGAVLVPLGMLRQRLEELPRDRLIVPFCKLSLRGYEAQRILTGAGFSAVSYLEGGIVGWPYALEAGEVRAKEV